ncbi:hypothetical protein N7478_003640 [Penicillium angulare]|uniref:uncharacterized protein n=1 Tax=Penicillium angulare TaxID=116970 RepID=UPI002541AB21|nr:uncharacterized protein N7478_003640 [Penicillium angulare]KAJ5287954.1 hypothetical protein N7478_003640 [Penicillium angulare]
MNSPSSTLSRGHRRQISTPGFEANRPSMANMPPRRTHRRGQTVDYGSFGPQQALDRRSATNKVHQLRDFFNEKSGFSQQALAAQQFMHSSQHGQAQFMHSHLPMSQPEQYQSAYMWNPEELQAMYTMDGSSAAFPAPIAPALARSASDNPNSNSVSTSALHQMQAERQHHLQSRQQANGYAQSMQQLSVQPEGYSPKINPYLSYTSPLTPDVTPMKSSFDLSMYTNDHTPTKSQSFSVPRTPATAEMQRAHSLQGIPDSTPVSIAHQMPSPATSVTDFAELAAMPSPGSCGVSPHLSSLPSSPSSSRYQEREDSPASSSGHSMHDMHAETVNEFDLDARVKASLKESSVSSDEIARFISGPDAKDNKWVCLFKDCRCRFGRKENIKSHVQTHLNDRQYVCDRCGKDFVRGHDLKRHLKTHSGKKPFACACGASFARQDALTRHRQRDMCVGGFTGFVPKTTKRGRPPKKSRPDIESRQMKSTRTRQRIAEKSFSTSVKVESLEGPMFNSPDYAPSTSMSSFTPPTSPGGGYDHKSPVQSDPSISSQQFEDDMLPLPLSPPQMAHNRYARAMEQFEGHNSAESSQDCLYSDPALSPYDMSSPHTAPTLAESTVGSEIDVFISQDATDNLQEEFGQIKEFEFISSQSSNLPSSYAYMDSADFGIPSSLYSDMPGKTISGLSALEMDPYGDQIDSLSSEFLVDP